MDSSSWRSYRIMAGDKDIQTQDQAHQVHGYYAVVDDNMGCGYCVSNHQATINSQHIITSHQKTIWRQKMNELFLRSHRNTR